MEQLLTSARDALLRIDPADDVAIAIRTLEPDEIVELNGARAGTGGEKLAEGTLSIRVLELIPRGHKVALRAIRSGSLVRKYGWPIGQAKRDIAAGSLVHTENLATQ